MTGKENTGKGTDYWSMNPDGSNKRRISDYNNTSLPSYKGKTIVSADSSFSPDGTKLLAYLQTDIVTQDGLTVFIEIDQEEAAEAITPIPVQSSLQEPPSSTAEELGSAQ